MVVTSPVIRQTAGSYNDYSVVPVAVVTYVKTLNTASHLNYTKTWQSILSFKDNAVQGGPAKVRPTNIFAGNIILVTFECIVVFGKF